MTRIFTEFCQSTQRPTERTESQENSWGTGIEHKLFFLKFFGRPRDIPPQNPGMSRQKVCFSWVSRDIPNFLAPTPSRGRSPPHPKISGTKKFGFGFLFLPETPLLTIFRQKKGFFTELRLKFLIVQNNINTLNSLL